MGAIYLLNVEVRYRKIIVKDRYNYLFYKSITLPHVLGFELSGGSALSVLVKLKAKHIDSSRMVIRVEQGKDRKDRFTILSQQLLKELRIYWKACRSENWRFSTKNSTRHIAITTAQRIY